MLRKLLTGFIAGELDPMLIGRSETSQYQYGLETCENFLPISEGPLVKRPGFAMIREADASASWLGAFRFSVTQEYVIEWGELKARFFTNGGRIETAPGVAYEIVTPYAAIEAPALSLQQNFDRLYIDHPAYPPAALRRDSAITFAHEVTELLGGPFADVNSDEAITVSASAVTGAVTLTANAPIFTAGEVGSLFYLETKDFTDLPVWEAGRKDVVIGNKVRNEGKAYQAATGGTTGTVQPTHSRGTEWDGSNKLELLNNIGPFGVKWTYLHDRFGTVQITGFTSATQVTGTVKRRLPDSLVGTPSFRWAHGAFSNAAGWPHLVTLFKGRLVHFKDFDIVGSVVGDYGGGRSNFASFTDSGALADDLAFRRLLSMDNPPLWVARTSGQLIVGTATAEFAIGPLNTGAAFSGQNITNDDQSFYGSEAVFPAQSGTETVFVERGGRRLRGADFDFARDRYDAPDLTASARHVTTSGILQLALQRNPWAVLYAVRGDGQLAMHARSRLEIKGFARIVLGGGARALSAVSIVGEDGKTDELWLLVERENGVGATIREIWQQARWRELGDNQQEQFFVDGGVRIAAAAGQTAFPGLTHLAGQDVAVLAAGAVVPNMTVSAGGQLDLPATSVPQASAFTVIVGLAYTARAVTLRPTGDVGGVPIDGVLQRVVRLATRVLETLGIKIGVPGSDPFDAIDRPANAPMDAPVPLFTGDVGDVVESDFDREGRATWISDVPLAAIVTSAALKLDVDLRDV